MSGKKVTKQPGSRASGKPPSRKEEKKKPLQNDIDEAGDTFVTDILRKKQN